MLENEEMAKSQEPIHIAFLIEPKPKKRPRVTRRGFAYTPKVTKDFESALQMMFRAQYKGKSLKGPLSVEVELFFTRPKKPKYTYPSVCDVDNCAKAVLDALNGLAWIDDRQIVSLICEKDYAPAGNQGYIKLSVCERHPGYAECGD